MLQAIERHVSQLWQSAPTDGVGAFLWQWGFRPAHPGTCDGVWEWVAVRVILSLLDFI